MAGRALSRGFMVVAAISAMSLSSCELVSPVCDVNWIGPAGGDFSVATSWDTGLVPTASQVACSGPGSSMVISDSRAVNTATFGGSVQVTATGTLTLSVAISSIVDLQLAGTIAGDGNLIAQRLTWTGGALTGSGFISTAVGPSTIAGNVEVYGTRVFGVQDNTTWSSGTIKMCDSTSFLVGGNGVFTAASPGAQINSTGCPAVGAVQVGTRDAGVWNATTSSTIAAPFQNGATLLAGCGVVVDVPSYAQPAATVSKTDLECGSTLRVAGGAGTAQLDAGTFAGDGTLSGSLAGSAAISPGDPNVAGSTAVLSVTGNYTAASGTTLGIDFNGTTVGSGYDRLAVGGTAALNGSTLNTTLGYAASLGHSFLPVTAASVTPSFTAKNLPVSSAFSWRLTYQPTSVLIDTLVIRFVAVDNSGKAFTSANAGTSWAAATTQPPTLGSSLTGVASNGNNFVAVSINGRAFTSADGGVNWVAAVTQPPGGTALYAVASKGARFVAVGPSGQTFVSADNGVNWAAATTPPADTPTLRGVTSNGSTFVAVGFKLVFSFTPLTYFSNDNGVTWTAATTQPNGFGSALRSVAANGTNFATGDTSTRVWTSADTGVTWTFALTNPSGSGAVLSLAANGANFVAGGSSGQLYRSSNNGVNWASAVTRPAGRGDFNGVAQINGNWVAVDATARPVTSTDNGSNWQAAVTNPPGAAALNAVSA